MINCSYCNFQKAQLLKNVKEIKPNTTLLFYVDTDRYDLKTIAEWFDLMQQILPENNIIWIPADMVVDVEMNED